MKKFSEELKKNFKNIYNNEGLSKYSWFNLGGPADIFFRPSSINQLSAFLKLLKNKNIPINILGAGSNTLIRDGGIKGIAIKLGSKFSYLNLSDKNNIEAGAATLDRQLSNFASDNSISGLEFLSCIPGSVGGAIKMNSGCYGSEISKILISIVVLDSDGNKIEIPREEINFFYRGCSLSDNFIILSAKFRGKINDKNKIKLKQAELIERKKNTQPNRVKTCGSTFKNPNNEKAWELIKKSKCDKMSVGEIRISEQHSNFFINNGKGTSHDIEELINKVRNEVLKVTGTNLELEIKIIGEKI